MTKNQSNLAQAFYAAKGTTAARLMEAIRACDLDPKVHGQDIAGFIEATGIRTPEDIPEGMIPELARHFTKARHEREEAETRTKAEAALQAASDGIMVYNENLAKGVPITNPDMLKKGAEIIKGLSIIGSAPPRQGITAETLFDFEVAEGFPVGFWNGLKIPAPGATIIGARTGQGKTSALVNIARELLGQGKRVSFVSYEMNAREIALAVTLSIMAEANTGPIASFDKNDPASYPGRRFYKPDDSAVTGGNADIYSDFFSELKTFIMQKGVPAFLKDAALKVQKFVASGSLAIHEAMGDADDLAEYISNTDFDAYVVDYLQAIPPGKEAATEGYRRIGSTVDTIRKVVNMGSKVLIMGAQFNRKEGTTEPGEGFDPVAEQFREAADIEQVAVMALGVGYFMNTEGEKVFYWKCLKHRFNAKMRDAVMLSPGTGWQYYYSLPGSPWGRLADLKAREGENAKKRGYKSASIKPTKITTHGIITAEDLR